MSDNNYIIQLTDGRKLQLSSTSVSKYPFIQNIINDLESSDETIFLPYADADALYEVLTTNFLHSKHPFLHFIRLIKAVDYLGSVDILDQMLLTVNDWFNNPASIEQLRQNKEEIINAILGLSPVIQDSLMYIMGLKPYTARLPPIVPFTINTIFRTNIYVSPNLDYIVTTNNLFLTPTMLYRGRCVPFPPPDRMTIKNKITSKPMQNIIVRQSVVTNLGDYYMVVTFEQPNNFDELLRFTIVIKYSKETKYEVGEVILDSAMTADGVLLSTNAKRYFMLDSKLKQWSIRDLSDDAIIFNGSAPSKKNMTIPTPNNRAILEYVDQGDIINNETNFYHITYKNNYISRESGKNVTILKGNVKLLVNDMFGALYDDIEPRGDYLIFSYAEDKWIEISSVNSRNISEELGIFRWDDKISIISDTGQVIAETHTKSDHQTPIGLTDKYLVTLNPWNGRYVVGKKDGVEMVWYGPVVSFLPIIDGHISDKAERELRVPLDLGVGKRKIALDWVFPGTNDTFLFIYSVDDGYYVVKYSMYDGKTLEEYLRDKL